MTAAFDEAGLRRWLVDYLVTNVGCSPDEIDLDVSLNDLAVGSSDAVVLCGELSELLGRSVSPVEFSAGRNPNPQLSRWRVAIEGRWTSRSPSSVWDAAFPAT
jgi:acyl carrier protein